MPKMKTNKGAARRFKVTGTGKVMMMKGLRSHNKRKKSKHSLRSMDKMFEVPSTYGKQLKKLLPYSK